MKIQKKAFIEIEISFPYYTKKDHCFFAHISEDKTIEVNTRSKIIENWTSNYQISEEDCRESEFMDAFNDVMHFFLTQFNR